jgi:hypothetical protein
MVEIKIFVRGIKGEWKHFVYAHGLDASFYYSWAEHFALRPLMSFSSFLLSSFLLLFFRHCIQFGFFPLPWPDDREEEKHDEEKRNFSI